MRKPQTGDFIPKELITSPELLERIKATAPKQEDDLGNWYHRHDWNGLRFTENKTWKWSKGGIYPATPITPEDILDPDPEPEQLKPGMWVEVRTTNQDLWEKRFLVGLTYTGLPITAPDDSVITGQVFVWHKNRVRPIPDPVQVACEKIKDKGIEITNFEKRIIRVLNDLGLLKE